mmetsp:Transcript_45575/g.80327  ORF Transcript_45575/g.80327 Transcript_45575/m.80327 type:complete len:335 (+) Transcript_45575:401-1405(+)
MNFSEFKPAQIAPYDRCGDQNDGAAGLQRVLWDPLFHHDDLDDLPAVAAVPGCMQLNPPNNGSPGVVSQHFPPFYRASGNMDWRGGSPSPQGDGMVAAVPSPVPFNQPFGEKVLQRTTQAGAEALFLDTMNTLSPLESEALQAAHVAQQDPPFQRVRPLLTKPTSPAAANGFDWSQSSLGMHPASSPPQSTSAAPAPEADLQPPEGIMGAWAGCAENLAEEPPAVALSPPPALEARGWTWPSTELARQGPPDPLPPKVGEVPKDEAVLVPKAVLEKLLKTLQQILGSLARLAPAACQCSGVVRQDCRGKEPEGDECDAWLKQQDPFSPNNRWWL